MVGILLLPLLIAVLGFAFNPDAFFNLLLGPIDDPSYFCVNPDPSPVPNIGAQHLLQECTAGKTISVANGETVAVDLVAYTGVDTSTQWTDLSVSNGQVLITVSFPAHVYTARSSRIDDIAVYRAARSGESTLSAVRHDCGGPHNACGREHRWRVTVRVS